MTRGVVRHRYREWPHLVDVKTAEPGKGELLVRVVATSLNTAKHDLLRRAGAARVIDHTTTDCTRVQERFDLVLDIAANRGPLAYRRAAAIGGRRIANLRWQASDPDGLATLAAMIERGEIAPIIDRVCTLDEIPTELTRLHAGEPRGKIIARVTECSVTE